MQVKRHFAEEVEYRRSRQEHTRSMTRSQQYIKRELQLLFEQTDDEELREKINVLEPVFVRSTPTSAVKSRIDFIRKHEMTGRDLVEELLSIYQQHRLQDRYSRNDHNIPQIVCSMALV